jgi:hypothetical protein
MMGIGLKIFCNDDEENEKFFLGLEMDKGMSGKESEKGQTEAGQDSGKDLEARLKELEKYLNGEFHERIKDFWPRVLKLYIDNVFDVFGLEDQFGYPLDAIVWYPYFKTGLLGKCTTRIEGISPDELGYYRVFEMRFL